MPRILRCDDCKTLDKLPDFNGNPDDDILLADLIARKHTGLPGDGSALHRGNLFVCDPDTWKRIEDASENNADAVLQKELEAIQGEAFASRDFYREDALVCFNRHGRPKEGCIDWMDASKRIDNPSPEGKKMAREHPRFAQLNNPHLCNFCPVASWVMVKQRAKRGDYKR